MLTATTPGSLSQGGKGVHRVLGSSPLLKCLHLFLLLATVGQWSLTDRVSVGTAAYKSESPVSDLVCTDSKCTPRGQMWGDSPSLGVQLSLEKSDALVRQPAPHPHSMVGKAGYEEGSPSRGWAVPAAHAASATEPSAWPRGEGSWGGSNSRVPYGKG